MEDIAEDGMRTEAADQKGEAEPEAVSKQQESVVDGRTPKNEEKDNGGRPIRDIIPERISVVELECWHF